MTDSSSPLQVIRQGSMPHPVIVVGLNEPLIGLNTYLSQETPIWWLRMDGLYREPYLLRSVEAMTDDFVAALTAAPAFASACLVGFSFGGLLACQLAIALRERQLPVALCLVEPALPGIIPTHAKPRVRIDPRNWMTKIRARLQTLGAHSLEEQAGQLGLWWLYRDQIFQIAQSYRIPGPFGPATIAGRETWLNYYLPTWQKLNAPYATAPLVLPVKSHCEPMLIPQARLWVNQLPKLPNSSRQHDESLPLRQAS